MLLVACLAITIFPQRLSDLWWARLPLAVVALAYGSNWAVLPASLVERFGHRHLGMSFNICSSLMAVVTTVLSILSGHMYDATAVTEARQAFENAEEEGICFGATCFRGIWALALVMSTIAWGTAAALHRMVSPAAHLDGQKDPVRL